MIQIRLSCNLDLKSRIVFTEKFEQYLQTVADKTFPTKKPENIDSKIVQHLI